MWFDLGEKQSRAQYFAALNTGQGFISYFSEIFDPCERVFVIKGGSGTGKSRLMRDISARAVSEGYAVEELLCSSDPSSLDGLIIPELSVAVLDGTAPHIHEPRLLGARDHIIDLSAFLDSEALKPRRAEIESMTDAKARRYRQIYEYLKVIGVYDNAVYRIALRALDGEKLDKAVEKSALYAGKSEKYEKRIRIRSAVSENGAVTLDTYARKADRRFAVSDACGIGGLYLKKLLAITDSRGARVEVSYAPYSPDVPDALYYPDGGSVFYIGCGEDSDERIINMRRFVDDELLRPFKPEIRAINRLRAAVSEQVGICFSAVRRIHASIEEIYSSAMDFKAKEQLTERIIASIF